MSCQITFSRYLADQDLPEHGIVAGNWYWRSDQEVFDENGTLVYLIGHRFLQREDEDDGIRPPRYAGNAYLTFLNCLADGGTVGDCSFGACNRNGMCCEHTFEVLCDGDFQGNGTECELPLCHEEGVCCNIVGQVDCLPTTREVCQLAGGDFVPGVSCDDAPRPCEGACCIWDQEIGLGCVDGFSPSQCAGLPGSPGAENIIYSIWQGPGTLCADVDCPAEGACCRGSGVDWVCEITSPDECPEAEPIGPGQPPVGSPGVFMGLGTHCSDPGACGGACCQFEESNVPGPGGGCFDVDRPAFDCIGSNRTFLGPGTTCADNAGDCGVCCLLDPDSCEIVCDENLLQLQCLNAGGTPFGPGSDCSVCDGVERACCIPSRIGEGEIGEDDPAGCEFLRWRCVNVRDCDTCADLGGFIHFETDCRFVPCRSTGGACCCPAGVCPDPPCPGGKFECTCYPTIKEDCPEACVWHGPGIGCSPSPLDPQDFPPPVPIFCLIDCDIVGCSPGPGS